MNKFIIVFTICIILLIILLVIIPLSFYNENDGSEDLIDEHGHHKYYERSIIEKEKYKKTHPGDSGKELRTWRRFFKNFNSNKN